MGNNSSRVVDGEMKCVRCNDLLEGKYIYVEVSCSSCDGKCKGYYHKECIQIVRDGNGGLLRCIVCEGVGGDVVK